MAWLSFWLSDFIRGGSKAEEEKIKKYLIWFKDKSDFDPMIRKAAETYLSLEYVLLPNGEWVRKK